MTRNEIWAWSTLGALAVALGAWFDPATTRAEIAAGACGWALLLATTHRHGRGSL